MISCELTDGVSSCKQQQEQHQPHALPHSEHAAPHGERRDITGLWLTDSGGRFDCVVFLPETRRNRGKTLRTNNKPAQREHRPTARAAQ